PAGARVVVDGERAQHGLRLGPTMLDVRVLADEVLGLDLRPAHSDLDDAAFGVEFGSECAVALLDPAGGAVDAEADGNEPVLAAGLEERSEERRVGYASR